MKKILAVSLALMLLLAPLGGCAKNEKTETLRLCEVTHSVFYAPLYAALELGCFEEEGLTIELTNGGGADKVMTAVLASQADIGLAGPEAAIYVHTEGREDAPRLFAQLTQRDGSFLVGREEEDFHWETLRGRTILGGRKGGVPEMTLEYVMRKNGVEPNVDAVVDTSVQFNLMAGAFTGGTGDYVMLFEPTATEVENEGAGHILLSLGEESGEIAYTAFFAAESLLRERGDAIAAFTRAVAKGQHYVLTHSPAEIAALIAPQFPDSDLALLERVTERHLEIGAWNPTPVVSETAIENLQTVMDGAGELTRRIPFDTLVDNSFAQAAALDG